MKREFILSTCKGCAHSRLVGGDTPNAWRVELCLYHVDHAEKHKRKETEVAQLGDLEVCPDPVRSARASGAI